MARPSLREKLASSAVDTLHTFGFKGCSIQDITDAAGVPKGSFFNHFENKEELAIDSLRRYLEGVRTDILFDESVPPLTRLKNHFSYLSERLVTLGHERGCMLGLFAAEVSADHPKMREELRSIFEIGVERSSWCSCAKRRPRAMSIPVMMRGRWRASWSMPGRAQRSGSRSRRTAGRSMTFSTPPSRCC